MRRFLVVALLTGCAHAPPKPVDTRPRLARAEAKALVQAELATPTTDAAVLTVGEAGYRAHCDRCHDFEAPSAYGRGDWEDILPEMVRESRVDAVEARAISAWVLAGAGT